MVSNYKTPDPYINEQVDLDNVFITDSWLVDQFVGGTVFWWGNGGLYTGVGLTSSPVQVGSMTNWKQVSCGDQHIGAVKSDGTLWMRGNGVFGQLGNGDTLNSASPIQVGSSTNWKQVSCGQYHTMAVKTDGTLWGWGYNEYRVLTVSQSYISSPIQIGSLTNWKQVSCGYQNYMLAIKTDGTLWGCGYTGYGNLGNGTNYSNAIFYASPIQIGSLTNWKQVSSGLQNNAAIKTDGTLWTWGFNGGGRLGNGTTINYSSPIQVGTLTDWKQVSMGNTLTAIKTDGTLWTCGNSFYGQLGNGVGANIVYTSPVQVGSMNNWKQVSSAVNFITAIKTDGTLWVCGYNGYGALGNGTTINYSSPIQIGSLTNWKQIDACGQLVSAITFRDLG